MTSLSSYPYDLGNFHRAVTSSSSDAQTWFDRGLTWTYGFHHEEATRCFKHAIDIDPGCVMAYWGMAYALGPNYNISWAMFTPHKIKVTLEQTNTALRMARTCSATPVERALVDALSHRFPWSPKEGEDPAVWNQAYVKAMGKVYEDFGDELDVAAIYADALMGLTPWQLWDTRTGEPKGPSRAIEAKVVIEKALKLNPALDHPGLLHLYIHLMEMSQTPEIALHITDKLRTLVPDAGHLHHMPSHLDILVGDYRRAIAANESGMIADARWISHSGDALGVYSIYRLHTMHTLIYAAIFAGRSRIALEVVGKMEAALSDELVGAMPDSFDSVVATRVHVLIRFGMWQEIIDYPLPTDQALYCVTAANILYAKGIALSATGRIAEAEGIVEAFATAMKRIPASRLIFPNRCIDVLRIGEAMLAGELEYRRGNYPSCFDHLRKAIELDDNLDYSEPWGWMQPVRHAYAALKLEQGDVEEAGNAYAADLGFDPAIPRARHHPNNVWALHGYHECLVKLGRTGEARIIEPQLKVVLAYADVDVRSSCYCRTVGEVDSHVEAGVALCCKL